MDINQLKKILIDLGATKLIYKALAENDNSKNQIYLGSSYKVLQDFPHGEIKTFAECKRPNYKASLDYWWISDSGEVCKAPNAQLILYPKYPEVRLSGFLLGCPKAPSAYLKTITGANRSGQKDGRVLIFAPVGTKLYAYLAPSSSSIAKELLEIESQDLFGEIILEESDPKTELIQHLRKEYLANPHEMVRIYSDGSIRPYTSINAAGYTLEASFGIKPNGVPEPDFKGWELKCYSHKSSAITLMTPEPDGGLYEEMRARAFVEKYGHVAEKGGMYFTGPYRSNPNSQYGETRRLIVKGFDAEKKKITDVDGAIILMQGDSEELATWSFSHILAHWSKKHDKACYVRYSKRFDGRIDYLEQVFLGEGTSPAYLLGAIVDDAVYYDPGIKIDASGKVKPRSQFRIRPKELNLMYDKLEIINLKGK